LLTFFDKTAALFGEYTKLNLAVIYYSMTNIGNSVLKLCHQLWRTTASNYL